MSDPSTTDELLTVQCCPCGHTYNMRRSKVMALIGTTQLNQIDAGIKVDAPILPSSDCETCKEEVETRDRLNAMMDVHW